MKKVHLFIGWKVKPVGYRYRLTLCGEHNKTWVFKACEKQDCVTCKRCRKKMKER